MGVGDANEMSEETSMTRRVVTMITTERAQTNRFIPCAADCMVEQMRRVKYSSSATKMLESVGFIHHRKDECNNPPQPPIPLYCLNSLCLLLKDPSCCGCYLTITFAIRRIGTPFLSRFLSSGHICVHFCMGRWVYHVHGLKEYRSKFN